MDSLRIEAVGGQRHLYLAGQHVAIWFPGGAVYRRSEHGPRGRWRRLHEAERAHAALFQVFTGSRDTLPPSIYRDLLRGVTCG